MIGRRGILYGGDYNPEQWDRSVWDEDMRLMAQARVNTVTLGVFSWSALEPQEGVFAFDWLDEALELTRRNGIQVILATPTASPPPWFTRAHPDGMPVRADGVRLVHGSRDTYNPASAAYRSAAARVAEALATRYGRHPSLVAWHLHNEYGTVSFGPETDAAFRGWLMEAYGSLDEVNRAWHTTFWSQGYRRWEEILAPQQTQYLPNPTQVLDFKRFTAAMLLECYREQIDVVRRFSPGVPITTNFMLPDWLCYDHWAFAEHSDFVSVDHYVDSFGLDGAAHAAFGGDLARSFGKGAPWVLMEQAANLTIREGTLLAKPAGELRRTTLQHLARGAVGTLFFQWRAPYAGAEFFHSTMVPHAGPDTRVFREVAELGKLVDSLAALAAEPDGATVRPRIAIGWDPDSWWAAETRSLPSRQLSFLRTVRAAHRATWYLGHTVDFVELGQDLSRYLVVLLPSQLLVSEQEAGALREYVRTGGTVVAWYFGGTFDPELHIIPGGYSGALADLLGIRVPELHPLLPGADVELDDGSHGSVWSEVVEPRGAETVIRYRGGPLEGMPAVTRNRVDAGRAWYLSTELDDDGLRSVLRGILRDVGVRPDADGAGDGLEIVRRYAGHDSFLIVVNHDAVPRVTRVEGTDLLTGDRRDGEVTVQAGDVLVIRESR